MRSLERGFLPQDTATVAPPAQHSTGRPMMTPCTETGPV